ncbi:MAG: hypothetical protein H0Z19_01940 [Archaeoglobus sp.]|uniref:hypothetical protein n=1 Tax=Archaeoglobus sp. TaxID=1872626 RepID=UPI001D67017A|nr:hypothetical protein [Archaeoglobus sp.]MBO8179234.1 hypothetical protein [Archaeoglobus sp.]
MIEFAYSLKNDARRAFDEIKSKAENLDFKPNLAIVYLTESLQKDAKVFKFNFNTLCIPVEGFITPEGVWTRGCLCMFADIEYSLNVFKGNVNEVVEQLRNAEKGKFNLLVYPLFYVESRYAFLGKYLRLKITSDLEKASKIYENLIYPMNTMLRPFRDESKEAVSLNLFPIKFGIGKPQIYVNGERVGRGVVHLSFDREFVVDYTDFLPERQKDIEQTKEILKKEFQFVEEVKVKKSRLAIGNIGELSIREYLRKHRIKMREDLEKDIEEEEFLGATPYGLLFFSRETGGVAGLGLMDYDLKFYPSLFDLTLFENRAIFFGEKLSGGISKIASELNKKRFDFILFDQYIMLMFEEKIVDLFKKRKKYGIITSCPSYTGNIERKIMTEIENKIAVNTFLSTVLINF